MERVEGIRGFVRVSGKLSTGGQPTADEFRALAEQGYEAVVNLGLLDPSYCLADEAGLVASLGMEYHPIPVVFGDPQENELRALGVVLDRLAGRKTFVHCAANKRASCMVALYKESRDGWSAERGDAFIRQIWEPDAVWSAFVAQARRDRGLGSTGQTSRAAGGRCVDAQTPGTYHGRRKRETMQE